MNWLKKQKSRGKENHLVHSGGTGTGRHRAANSARNIPPPPPLNVPLSPKHKRAQSASGLTSPKLLSPADKRKNVLAMCNDFVQSQRSVNHRDIDDREPLFAAPSNTLKSPIRKSTESFAAHLNEFGNTNDLDDLFFDTDDDDLKLANKKKKKGSFATHLSEFVGHGAGDLDAIVNDIDSDIYKNQEEKQAHRVRNRYHHSAYKERLDTFTRNKRQRKGTISKLKEEIAQSPHSIVSPSMSKIKNKYKKRANIYNKRVAFSFVEEEESTNTKEATCTTYTSSSSSFTSMASNTFRDQKMIINKKQCLDDAIGEWHKYLLSINQYLSQNVQYFEMIEEEMSTNDINNNNHHAMERILITKMKHWIERYGIAAMTSYEEAYQLKKQLIKSHEEANTLEEESVQLTQKVFGLEHEMQRLSETVKRQESEMEILHKAIQSYKREIKMLSREQERGRRAPPPRSSSHPHQTMPALQLSGSVHKAPVTPPPPPPPRTPPRSPSPIPLKQSYSENILDVEPLDLQRPRSQPEGKQSRLKPNLPVLRQGRHSQPNIRSQIYDTDDQLATQNEHLLTQLRLLNETKSELQTELVQLKKERDLFADNATSLTPKFKAKKRKSLINFKKRKSNNEEINEGLTKVINEMSQQKYIWASEKNALCEEILRLNEQIKCMEATGGSHRILDSDDIHTLKAGKEAMARKEQEKKTPGWKPGSFGDKLNNFAIAESCDMDDVLAAITNDIAVDVDHELTETELSGLQYIGDEKGANIAHDIVVTAEIDEYENSDDGWVSSEEGDIESNAMSNFVLSQSTTQSITTSSVSTTAYRQKPAKITKVVIPKQSSRFNGILSKFVNNSGDKKKALPPPLPSSGAPVQNATTVIANVKRTKRRFFHPTKHGFLCIDKSKLWQRDNSKPKVYAAIDGLPSSTNLNASEPDWKKRKDNDILVPFFCLFKHKNDYENLCSMTAHKSVRDILFQKKFAQYCSAFIRLDTAMVHWDLNTLLKDLDTQNYDDNDGTNMDSKFFIASNVDRDKKYIEIHSFMTNDEQTRNQWFSAIQQMIDRRRASAHRRSVHGNTHQNPSSGRYKMKLF